MDWSSDVCSSDLVTRGTVIGLSIAEAAFGGEPGADGVAAGAFRQRAEIINARMLLEGTPAEAGEWRFSALPWFDPATGQFRGYRASARRPQRNETRSEEHTSELQSLMRISYAVFCLKKQKRKTPRTISHTKTPQQLSNHKY